MQKHILLSPKLFFFINLLKGFELVVYNFLQYARDVPAQQTEVYDCLLCARDSQSGFPKTRAGIRDPSLFTNPEIPGLRLCLSRDFSID